MRLIILANITAIAIGFFSFDAGVNKSNKQWQSKYDSAYTDGYQARINFEKGMKNASKM